MSYTHTYLAVASGLIRGYRAPQPFHLYLKKYFSANKKHGSRDRKIIAALCYASLRLGKNFEEEPIENKILIGISLCHPEMMNAEWETLLTEKFAQIDEGFSQKSVSEKISLLKPLGFDIAKLFPFSESLSAVSDKDGFLFSQLSQPRVWLRAKKNKREKLDELLTEAHITKYTHPNLPNAVGLPQNTNIEQVLGNRYYHFAEVQDASSQLTGNFIVLKPNDKVWDCCCGAGGKSLMLCDSEPKIELYCSDIRAQILNNLHERFKASGLPRPFTVAKDIGTGLGDAIVFENKNEYKTVKGAYFDIIVADVPCSGSGTWSRTPEQAYGFTEEQITSFTEKQRTIVTNVVPFMKKGGRLFYITCSLYEAENEGQLPYFESLGLKIGSQQIIEGWHHNADTMFIACLVKQ